MRIAIAGQVYYPGNNGQAIFTIHLAEGLVRAGHDVAMITPSPDIRVHQDEINGVKLYFVRSIPLTWIHNGAYFNPMPGMRIHSIFKEFKPDVLHVQDHYFIDIDAVEIARRMKIPVIGTNHFLPENLMPYIHWIPVPKRFKAWVLWQIMLFTFRKLDLITTPTATAARILGRQKINVPIVPISCGVDTHVFSPAPVPDRAAFRRSLGLDEDRVTFLYVGRQDREKRVDLIIRGLARLKSAQPQADPCLTAQLAIAGQGSARQEFEALARSLGVEGDVRFLGYVPQEKLPDLYRSSDVFCMASPEELQSIATLEAMASGKPILAANARALPELVSPGVNGYLFDPGSTASMENAMRQMIACKNEWGLMGQASRERAISHSLDHTIQSYTDMYERLKGLKLNRSQDAKSVQPVRG